jgi:hypothetical protein
MGGMGSRAIRAAVTVATAVALLAVPAVAHAQVVILTPAPTPAPTPQPAPSPAPSDDPASAVHVVSEPSPAMRRSRPVVEAPGARGQVHSTQLPRGDVRKGVPVITYRVGALGVDGGLAEFAAVAHATLNDPRGWGAGRVRFERVVQGSAFRLWLADRATVATADPTCSPRYSCRVGRNVLINASRWRHGAKTYDDRSLQAYRRYVINHEVGHWLGLDHRGCSTAGARSPVMQQQTISLGGCTSRVWPGAGERRLGLQTLRSD